jgi:hypothetical protein
MRSRVSTLLLVAAFSVGGVPVLAGCGEDDRPEAEDIERGAEDAVQEGRDAAEDAQDALEGE